LPAILGHKEYQQGRKIEGQMRRSRTSVVLALVLVVVSTVASVPGSAAGPAQPQLDGVDPDAVVMRVSLQANGDATWALSYRVRLDGENATDAFESLAADVEANETAFTAPFRDGMERTAASAENATGREMAIENVSVSTARETLPKEYGVVTYRFTWTGFTAVDGETLRAGDAIAGLFLDSDTTLVVTWPDSYRLASASPEPAQRKQTAVTWTGPTKFGSNEPSLTVEPAPETTSGGESPTESTAASADGGGVSPWLVVAVVALLAGVAGAVWYRRQETEGEAVAESDGDDGEDGTGDESESDVGDDEPPSELLSNEERVLQLLDDRGGRMKQQQVA
jgi:hypothetical protein